MIKELKEIRINHKEKHIGQRALRNRVLEVKYKVNWIFQILLLTTLTQK